MFTSELRRLGRFEVDATMTRKQFNSFIRKNIVAAQLRELGIDVSRIKDPFFLMNVEAAASITAEGAARGVLALRGPTLEPKHLVHGVRVLCGANPHRRIDAPFDEHTLHTRLGE